MSERDLPDAVRDGLAAYRLAAVHLVSACRDSGLECKVLSALRSPGGPMGVVGPFVTADGDRLFDVNYPSN